MKAESVQLRNTIWRYSISIWKLFTAGVSWFVVMFLLLLKVYFQYSEALPRKHLISAVLCLQSQMTAPLYCAHKAVLPASVFLCFFFMVMFFCCGKVFLVLFFFLKMCFLFSYHPDESQVLQFAITISEFFGD